MLLVCVYAARVGAAGAALAAASVVLYRGDGLSIDLEKMDRQLLGAFFIIPYSIIDL